MNTETQKNISDLERRVAGIQVDYDFYSTGFPYTSVEAKSANHIYGNGKWKKTIIDALGEEVFKQHCDKYTNGNSTKAIDFKIACFKTKHAPYFKMNETINVKDNNNLYSGTFKVVESNDEGVSVLMPYKGTSTGKLINVSRKNGAEGSLKRHIQMLTDIKPTQNTAPLGVGANNEQPTTKQEMKSNYDTRENTSMIEEFAAENKQNASFWDDKDKKKKVLKTVAWVGGILLALITAYIMYKKYNKNS
jgi:hypothetical protein